MPGLGQVLWNTLFQSCMLRCVRISRRIDTISLGEMLQGDNGYSLTTLTTYFALFCNSKSLLREYLSSIQRSFAFLAHPFNSHWHVGMDQYLLIPFLGDEHPFTSYFDVHQGYKVLTHCHVFSDFRHRKVGRTFMPDTAVRCSKNGGFKEGSFLGILAMENHHCVKGIHGKKVSHTVANCSITKG